MCLELLESSPLWASVLDRVQVNRALTQQADEMKATCGTQSAAIFQSGLDKPLWSVLAIGAGLLPPARLSADSPHDAQDVPLHETFEYLEPPWEVRNGKCVVKGTSFPFEVDESGGPLTKYAALFDCRP